MRNSRVKNGNEVLNPLDAHDKRYRKLRTLSLLGIIYFGNSFSSTRELSRIIIFMLGITKCGSE